MGLFSRKKKEAFACPMTGVLHPIEEVPDPVFSEKTLGEGFAVELTGREVKAPVSGTISAAFPTGHAFGITTKDGMEILIHIGIETVALEGAGFEVKKKQGDAVKQGDVLRSRRGLLKKPGQVRIFPGDLYRRAERAPVKIRKCAGRG